jgi:hypothetical protein
MGRPTRLNIFQRVAPLRGELNFKRVAPFGRELNFKRVAPLGMELISRIVGPASPRWHKFSASGAGATAKRVAPRRKALLKRVRF